MNENYGFHHSSIQKIVSEMNLEINKYTFEKPSYKILGNFDAQILDLNSVRNSIAQQIYHPVQFQDCVLHAIEIECTVFIDVNSKARK